MATSYRKSLIGFGRYCAQPEDLDSVTVAGVEDDPRDVGVEPAAIEAIWKEAEKVYASGLHPAVQLSIRCDGRVVLHRAIGDRRGNAPGDPVDAPKERVTLDTPFVLYSASKAITAMLVLKLDELGKLHVEDRVADYVPEFGKHGKDRITIRHVLTHRAGIPLMPVGAEKLVDGSAVLEALCDAKPSTRPGKTLAYHAVSGGFLLGEVAERVTGESLRALLRRLVAEPLGLRWMTYGTDRDRLPELAEDAFTGPPVLPPASWLLARALGGTMDEVVRVGNSPEFRTTVIPAGNTVATADDLSKFYACLAAGGSLDGVSVFDEATIRRATSEQSHYEIDSTLLAPQRWGMGIMLGDKLSLFGLDTAAAFGHLGFTNILGWADPERRLGVALLDSGKPFLSLGVVPLINLVRKISATFPKRG